MRVARTLPELHRALAELGAPVCLVPTMGALHEGHLALVGAARARGPKAAAVAASIFVNPLQFDRPGDLARYPRDEANDLAKLAGAGCDLAWLPDAATMYPPGGATTIDPAGPALRWEGAHRPGHFRGVATVVAKLFGQLRPANALFGEKDWQQLQVVRRMAADLCLPVRVEGLETVRAPDGLALSSRNRFLSAGERARAPALFATLRAARAALRDGADAAGTIARANESLRAAGFAVDYFAWVDSALEPVSAPAGNDRLLAAARLGAVRLLDNLPVSDLPRLEGGPGLV